MLGTPPRSFAVIVDTGSTITYVPCSTCGQNCGPHHKVQILINLPSHSLSSSSPLLLLLPSCRDWLAECKQFSAILLALSKPVSAEDMVFITRPAPLSLLDRWPYNLQDAAFDPVASGTSSIVSCGNEKCVCGRPACSCSPDNLCMYSRTYGKHPSQEYRCHIDKASRRDPCPHCDWCLDLNLCPIRCFVRWSPDIFWNGGSRFAYDLW